MSKTMMSVQLCAQLTRAILQTERLPRGKVTRNGVSRRKMATDCDDHTCGKEQNYWKGKIEMPEYAYLQPKRPQFDPNLQTDVKEKPDVPRNLDIYKERNCRIIQDCKKAASGENRPKCKRGV